MVEHLLAGMAVFFLHAGSSEAKSGLHAIESSGVVFGGDGVDGVDMGSIQHPLVPDGVVVLFEQLEFANP